jgi:hypothetical protein
VGTLRGEAWYRENPCGVREMSVEGGDVVCVIHEDPLRFVQPLDARMRGQVV